MSMDDSDEVGEATAMLRWAAFVMAHGKEYEEFLDNLPSREEVLGRLEAEGIQDPF